MKPELLNRFLNSQQIFMIKTVGGRKLKATPIFGDTDYGPVKFRYSDYETIPSKSVRTADKIIDYYYSPTAAMRNGHCSIDGIKYTEGVPHGKKPVCNVDDAELVAVKYKGIVKTCCPSKKQTKDFLYGGPRYSQRITARVTKTLLKENSKHVVTH